MKQLTITEFNARLATKDMAKGITPPLSRLRIRYQTSMYSGKVMRIEYIHMLELDGARIETPEDVTNKMALGTYPRVIEVLDAIEASGGCRPDASTTIHLMPADWMGDEEEDGEEEEDISEYDQEEPDDDWDDDDFGDRVDRFMETRKANRDEGW